MRAGVSAVVVLLTVAVAAWGQDDGRGGLLRYQWNEGNEIFWNVTTESTGMVLTRGLTRDPLRKRRRRSGRAC